jgi:heptosyltransferase-2
MKVALFLPNWVGDAVMATPAVRWLKQSQPETEFVGVGLPHIVETLAENPYITRTIIRNPKGKDKSQKGWDLYTKLQAEKFDAALLMTNSFRSAWQAYWTGAAQRIGFDRDGRRLLLTQGIASPRRKIPHPVLEDYMQIAGSYLQASVIPDSNTARQMDLAITDTDQQKFQALSRKLFGRETAPCSFICLNPGGAFGAAKHWPVEHFAKLARRLAQMQRTMVVVMCGPTEREIARHIVTEAQHPAVVSLADESVSIGLSKAIVKHARILITTDSGPRHFAAPFGVPVVTLFGPTHIEWSETFYPLGLHLQEKVDCGPCQKRLCPLKHHRCMQDLSVDRVYASVLRMLQMTEENQTSKISA